jgi:hypothetical protein
VVLAGRALYGAFRSRFRGGGVVGGGPGAASVHDEAFAQNRAYRVDTDKVKHTGSTRQVGSKTVSPEPKNGPLMWGVAPREGGP